MVDKGGVIVIMDKSEHISVCDESVIDKTSYEELPTSNPNS